MLEIKDFRHKLIYSRLVEQALFSYLWEGVLKPMFEIMGVNEKNIAAKNDLNVLIEALNDNKIIYVEKGFKSLTGKFTNKVAKELEKLGAKYDKWEKVYKIPMDKIPLDLRVALANSQRIAQEKIQAIDKFLNEVQANLPDIIDSMIFDTEYETIIDDVTGEINKSVKKQIHTLNYLNEKKLKKLWQSRPKQLELIPSGVKDDFDIGKLDLTDEDINAVTTLSKKTVKDIAANYTNNMQFYIKKFAEKRIPEMRRKVMIAVLSGYREDFVRDMLQKEYKIDKDKAKFLAQNETSILIANLKKNLYKEMGFTHFRWNAIMDAKVREEHAHLNGTIWAFDDPPEIDEHTHQKGLPGETYNCRCGMTPINPNSQFAGVL